MSSSASSECGSSEAGLAPGIGSIAVALAQIQSYPSSGSAASRSESAKLSHGSSSAATRRATGDEIFIRGSRGTVRRKVEPTPKCSGALQPPAVQHGVLAGNGQTKVGHPICGRVRCLLARIDRTRGKLVLLLAQPVIRNLSSNGAFAANHADKNRPSDSACSRALTTRLRMIRSTLRGSTGCWHRPGSECERNPVGLGEGP